MRGTCLTSESITLFETGAEIIEHLSFHCVDELVLYCHPFAERVDECDFLLNRQRAAAQLSLVDQIVDVLVDARRVLRGPPKSTPLTA